MEVAALFKAFIVCPRGSIGRLHANVTRLEVAENEFLDIVVRGTDTSGSENITAVAGTVLGTRKEL